jgi:CelD/BcsL family acetyltransferase involved in cellulose biosynthesis
MITELHRIEQLDDLRDAWDHLQSVTPESTFFHSLDWLQTYWKHYGARQQLKVLVSRTAGEVTGIVPLVVRRERTKIGGLRFLTYPLDYWGSFYSPLAADRYACLAAGLDYLKGCRRTWDLLELRWLGSNPTDCQRTAETLIAAGHNPSRCLVDQSAVVHLPPTWQGYLAQRTSKWRNNLKRWQRKTQDLGELTYLRYRPAGGDDGDPRWDLFDACVTIAQSSWQSTSPDGTTLSHDSIQGFLREAHAAAAARGSVDLNLLYLDGKPVAFGYNYVYQQRLFGMRIGYDPAVKACGAGNLLYTHMIEDSCQRGDLSFDLGPGSLECKQQFLSEVLPIYRLTCYQKFSLGQQLMRIKHQYDTRRQEEPVT